MVARNMDESSGNATGGSTEMLAKDAANTGVELRNRRSTRIAQAVPLAIAGVDALGRSFLERTSSLIINCHGCRYQSKHYVLKNMWVTMEIPHPEAGQPTRSVRGRVAWIQRPRTVRQLFQVALELEHPGNAWGIAFPPEDWFPFTAHERAQPPSPLDSEEVEATNLATADEDLTMPLGQTDPEGAAHATFQSVPHENAASEMDPGNLRVFPSPGSVTDASLQLARQFARLVADAKQQIHAAAREAATQAVYAERQATFGEWEQQSTAQKTALREVAARAVEQIQKEAGETARLAHASAGESLRDELPRWLAARLQELTEGLTTQLSEAGARQRDEHARHLLNAAEPLRELCRQAEEAGSRLASQAQQAESRIADHADTAARTMEAAAHIREEAVVVLRAQADETTGQIAEQAKAVAHSVTEADRLREESTRLREEGEKRHRESVEAATLQFQERIGSLITSALSQAQSSWQEYLMNELGAAQARWHGAMESTARDAQKLAENGLEARAQAAVAELQAQTHKHAATIRETADSASAQTDQRMAELAASAAQQREQLDAAVERAGTSTQRLQGFSTHLETLQQQALAACQSQLDDVLSLHRNELHRISESLFEELHARVDTSFQQTHERASAQFGARLEQMVLPHLADTEELIHRLDRGRALVESALTQQQDLIRSATDEAFAQALSRFQDGLGAAEGLLQERSQQIIAGHLVELEGQTGELKHRTIHDLFASAEWYEKKAQTQMQGVVEKTVELGSAQLREKAGEISGMFASELDHASRNFVSHTYRQMEEVVRDSFERARSLYAEAAETTAAAFTDEVQRAGRQELDGFGQELRAGVAQAHTDLEVARTTHREQVTREQEDFLLRFRSSMQTTLDTGVAEAQQHVTASFSPVLEAWKTMTAAHQSESQAAYVQMGEDTAEQYRHRLESVSNQWMLATVASLDHQSRDVVASVAVAVEKKLRETCAQVFAGIGDTLRERLQEIAQTFSLPIAAAPPGPGEANQGDRGKGAHAG
ncbi:MAG: hypothetical protein NVS9B4_17880 [Candidatus Acidiferrum sp.]